MFNLARPAARGLLRSSRTFTTYSPILSNAKPYPATSTSNPAIVPTDEYPETSSRMEEKDLKGHHTSGLTTSHPSPEIVAADVLSDAPREF